MIASHQNSLNLKQQEFYVSLALFIPLLTGGLFLVMKQRDGDVFVQASQNIEFCKKKVKKLLAL